MGDSKMEDINIPDWIEDPFYKKSQDELFPMGKNLLSGNIPEYYSPIGEMGGDTFNKFLQSSIGDITKSVQESSAAMGIRGPRGAAATAEAVGQISPALRYQDQRDAIEGRKFLLGAGSDILSGVRGGALNWMNQRNDFSLGATGLEMDKAGYMDEFDERQQGKFMRTIAGALPLIAAPFTGGASLGLYGAGGATAGITSSLSSA